MYRNDFELAPVTYSIKSYRKKKGYDVKKIFFYGFLAFGFIFLLALMIITLGYTKI